MLLLLLLSLLIKCNSSLPSSALSFTITALLHTPLHKRVSLLPLQPYHQLQKSLDLTRELMIGKGRRISNLCLGVWFFNFCSCFLM
ncbi:unnamed protein product [Brassica oleracea]